MLVCYWHKTGMDIFSIKDNECIKLNSGWINTLRPIKGIGKKVLVVARDMLLHIRKKYPPTTPEKIKKAIQMEIGELFPLENPAFYFRIFEKTSSYCLVDIWAWPSNHDEEIKKVFPFTHILPEDVAFISEEPEVTIFEEHGLWNLIAHDRSGFIKGLSAKTLTEETIERFLHSLGRYADKVKRIRIYGMKRPSLHDSITNIPILHEPPKNHPISLRDLNRLDLREFKVKRKIAFTIDLLFLVRVSIYFLIIYSLCLYINKRYYERAINEVSKRLDVLKVEQSTMKKETEKGRYSEVINALKEKRKARLDPLLVMDALAQSLPEGSYITRMVLEEEDLEISVNSNEPIEVIKRLSQARCVKSVRLKGTPMKVSEGRFGFILSLGLMPCR